MIKAHFDWHGNEAKVQIVATAWDSLRRAVEFYWNKLLEVLSVPNTGVRVKRRYAKGTYTVYPNPAPKGMPPRLRTGWLRKHVQREYDKDNFAARVGVNKDAIYGLFLELKDHPWLLITLEKHMDVIRAIAAGGK